MRMVLILSLIFLSWCVPAEALTQWCDNTHGDQMCALMEDVGNETDASRGNTLTETGGTIPRDADRQFGDWSRDFEMDDTEYLTHADSLATDISGADQSISMVMWIKPETISGDQSIISKWNSSTSERQYLLRIDQSAGPRIDAFLSRNGIASQETQSDTNIQTGVWQHIGFVSNDIDMRIYLDGVLDNTPQAYTAGIADKGRTFKVGAFDSEGSPSAFFDGLIDDVGIFDVALSSTDINDIMDNGLVQAVTGRTRRFF